MRVKILLILIFVLALGLRVYDLGNVPKGLQLDELNAGYQGYKIIKTGSDIFGNALPLYINRFGDYRPAGIFYIDGIFTSFFSLNNFFIRFPAALFGALTIVPLFFLTVLVSKNKTIGLLSSLLLAISPWHIVASRSTSESIIALFFTILGVGLMTYSLEFKKSRMLIPTFLVFILSYFFYHTPRAFIPVFLLITMMFIYKANRMQKYLLIFFLFILITSIGISFTSFGRGRFEQTSIFVSSEIREKIKNLEDGDQGNIFAARIFHNKPVVFTKAFIDQYLSYFSTQFLFTKGGLPNRYVVNDVGLFYYIELPLLLLGMFFLVKKGDKFFFLPFIWLLCAPIAAALTLEDSPNIQRAIFMLPAFQIIEAYGLYFLILKRQKILKYLLIVLLTSLFLTNIVYFLHQYFVHISLNTSFARDEGNDQLFSFLFKYEGEYDKILIPSFEDLPMYYYYFKHDKSTILTLAQSQTKKGFQIGKYIFVPDNCPEKLFKDYNIASKEKVIIVDSVAKCTPDVSSLKNISTIGRRDGTTGYTINEYINKKQ